MYSSLAVLEQAEGSIVQERLNFLTQFCKKPVFPLLNKQTKVLQKKSVVEVGYFEEMVLTLVYQS